MYTVEDIRHTDSTEGRFVSLCASTDVALDQVTRRRVTRYCAFFPPFIMYFETLARFADQHSNSAATLAQECTMHCNTRSHDEAYDASVVVVLFSVSAELSDLQQIADCVNFHPYSSSTKVQGRCYGSNPIFLPLMYAAAAGATTQHAVVLCLRPQDADCAGDAPSDASRPFRRCFVPSPSVLVLSLRRGTRYTGCPEHASSHPRWCDLWD